MDQETAVTPRVGFWSGMPTNLKSRAFCWTIYYLLAAFVFTREAILGIVLLLLPGFWYVAKNWLLGEIGRTLDAERKDTLSGYLVRYLFGAAPVFVRVAVGVLTLVTVLLGLGWISTEDLRIEAAKPTLTERVTGAADAAVEATKETTGGWIDTAKGWFKKDPDDHSP